jgi:hypothetical protein
VYIISVCICKSHCEYFLLSIVNQIVAVRVKMSTKATTKVMMRESTNSKKMHQPRAQSVMIQVSNLKSLKMKKVKVTPVSLPSNAVKLTEVMPLENQMVMTWPRRS